MDTTGVIDGIQKVKIVVQILLLKKVVWVTFIKRSVTESTARRAYDIFTYLS